MRRLIRALVRALLPPRGEHGVITALVAVLAGTGVLLGMAALVIDIGALYAEREQLQSGADAASWKVAQSCVAMLPALCTVAGATATAQTTNAQTYANRNAKDLVSGMQLCINVVSASGVTTKDPNCPATWNTPVTCPALPVSSGPFSYVEVRTTTRNADGTTVVPPLFGQAIAGTPYTGAMMGACGRVAWGVPAVEDTFAFGISKCDFLRMTNNNTTNFAPPLLGGLNPLLQGTGVYSLLGLSSPSVNYVAISNGILSTSCPTTITETVAGYAWLGQPNGSTALLGILPVHAPDPTTCNLADIPATNGSVDSWVGGFTISLSNASAATTCINKLNSYVASGQPVLVPIFDRQASLINLLPSYYRVIGFAPFVFTGYETLVSGLGGLLNGVLAPNSSLNTVVTGVQKVACALQSCVYGYFTKTLVTDHVPTQFATSPNFGATVIGRTG
ncbi:pilus assembly protein TadG-related protein [Actinoplanes sp. HUAS TT8]|uniref:pilus assembly protein TadG-related protein n=1 Tax=Actinoplanes sp. HUAS TT8 TaxID=3447453 RepID=UPI003F523126